MSLPPDPALLHLLDLGLQRFSPERALLLAGRKTEYIKYAVPAFFVQYRGLCTSEQAGAHDARTNAQSADQATDPGSGDAGTQQEFSIGPVHLRNERATRDTQTRGRRGL